MIDDLRRELEYLQCFKLEMEHPGKGKGLSELNAKTREMEMEHEVKRLKQVDTLITGPLWRSHTWTDVFIIGVGL